MLNRQDQYRKQQRDATEASRRAQKVSFGDYGSGDHPRTPHRAPDRGARRR